MGFEELGWLARMGLAGHRKRGEEVSIAVVFGGARGFVVCTSPAHGPAGVLRGGESEHLAGCGARKLRNRIPLLLLRLAVRETHPGPLQFILVFPCLFLGIFNRLCLSVILCFILILLLLRPFSRPIRFGRVPATDLGSLPC